MLKYAKIDEHGNLQVGLGSNDEYYKLIGMSLMDIEQLPSGEWKLASDITVDDYISNKLSELSESYSRRISGYIITSLGYRMQFSTEACNSLASSIDLMENILGESYGYLTQYDNTTIENVPLKNMKQTLNEMKIAFGKCHKKKQELRSAINNCKTIEELNSIDISWPI